MLSWQGRRLRRYGNDEYYAEYTYDVDGMRTSKYAVTPVGTFNSKYIYDGKTLVAEQRNGKWIYYIYGVDGVAGFNYNGITYLYRKNVQGDVTHIYKQEEDKPLILVAQYVYDAWGNIDILQNTDGIATLNPFRYRSYYFDEETGLYYLQSRYYDPELGRFISADSIEYLDPETIGGLNLYAYCENNPVMGVDPEGTWNWGHFWKIVAAVAIVVAVTALTVVTAGAAAAALGVSATAVMVTTAVCGVVGGVAEIVGQCVNNGIDNLNLWDVAVETFTNAAYGGAAAIGAGTGSLVIKMATRGVIVGLSGLNTYMHGIYKVKNLEMTQEELQKKTALSLGTASLIQFGLIGLGKLNVGVGAGNSPLWLKQVLVPTLVTIGKTTYRHNKEEINTIAQVIGKIILWTLLRKYLTP